MAKVHIVLRLNLDWINHNSKVTSKLRPILIIIDKLDGDIL